LCHLKRYAAAGIKEVNVLTAEHLVPPVNYPDQACEQAKAHVRELGNGKEVVDQVRKDLICTMVGVPLIHF
jgi:uncharacterized protein YkwD